jgi:hypothetical protein
LAALGVAGGLVLIAGIVFLTYNYPQYLPGLERRQPADKPDQPRPSPREQRVVELQRIADELRAAVLAEDIEALLKYDRRNAELEEPRPESSFPEDYGYYEADRLLLGDRKSWLYCQIFDTPCTREIARQHGGLSNPFLRISIKEFLVTAASPEVRVIFYGNDQGGENLDLAIILYVRPNSRVRLPAIARPSPDDPVPLTDWGKEYVGVELERTKHGWRYSGVMFTITPDESNLG